MKKTFKIVLFSFLIGFVFSGCSDLVNVLMSAQKGKDVPADAFVKEDETDNSDGSSYVDDGIKTDNNNQNDVNIPINDNQVQIRDCDTGVGIANMPVKIVSSTGQIVFSGYTNSNGFITLPSNLNLSYGEYTISINTGDSSFGLGSTGYVGFSDKITIDGNKIKTGNSISVPKKVDLNTLAANSKIIKVILDWGTTPKDLDLHTVFGVQHVYYLNKSIGNVNLDRDDIDSYGPETITIKTSLSDSAEYNCYVHNYTDSLNTNSNRLASSGARVRVYINNEHVKTYFVPSDNQGLNWNVCKIKNGKIVEGSGQSTSSTSTETSNTTYTKSDLVGTWVRSGEASGEYAIFYQTGVVSLSGWKEVPYTVSGNKVEFSYNNDDGDKMKCEGIFISNTEISFTMFSYSSDGSIERENYIFKKVIV